MKSTFSKMLLFVAIVAASSTGIAHAGVGDPTIETDHPIYAGEGAFQSVEGCVDFATKNAKTTQDKAIAMYLWILSHQFHTASPQEWNVAGMKPDTRKSNKPLGVKDSNRARFSYGFALCGTVHAWNEAYWKAMGLEARRRGFPGHTNSEIKYDGAWHTFDTDMAGLVFRKDGVVAGYADVIKDPSIVEHTHPPIPCYPFAWPSDYNSMRSGWKEVVSRGDKKWTRLYAGSYAAHPGIVNLRSGETFTRWFDRDHYGGMGKRRFWYHGRRKGGPSRSWTFVNKGDTDHPKNVKRSDYSNGASYCNADFVYAPDLSSDKYREGVVAESSNVAHGASSPKLKSADGKKATVAFEHFSPYVIAGDPADDQNSMTGTATDGLVVSGKATGKVGVEVSVDQGQSWEDAGSIEGDFELDLTENVKGRYGWQVRFTLEGKNGLDAVQFATSTQVNQSMYPRLKPNGSAVTYRAGSRGVVAMIPNFGLSEKELEKVEVRSLRSDNMAFSGQRKSKGRFAYSTTTNKPGTVVFKVEAPEPLLEVSAMANFKVRVPPPANTNFRLEISTDEGKTWKLMSKAVIPSDNDHSNGYVSGKVDVSAAKTKTAFIRAQAHQDGYSTGLFDVRAYGTYETSAPQETTITYGWKEGDTPKTHTEQVAAGAESKKFTVPTGASITDDFIRIEVK